MSKLIMTPMESSGKKFLTAALFEEGRLCQMELCGRNQKKILGNIYIGKVQNIAGNIRAAFIDIGDGCTCYYSMDESVPPIITNRKTEGPLRQGDEVLVQVSKEEMRGKLPCVTCNLNFPGRYLAVTAKPGPLGISSKLKTEEKARLRDWMTPLVPKDAGLILRTNSRDASFEELEKEWKELYQRYCNIREIAQTRTCYSLLQESMPEYMQAIQNVNTQELEEIITDDESVYEQILIYLEQYGLPVSMVRFYEDRLLSLARLYSLETALHEALSEKVWLKSGGYLVIQQTEAFVSIDVNSGKFDGKKDSRETFRKINLEAAKEIARQLRIRNLSGMILIDFINLKAQQDKDELLHELQKYLNQDPIRGIVVDITGLNIVEVTRKKIRRSLAENWKE